jgi:hypothetical protein
MTNPHHPDCVCGCNLAIPTVHLNGTSREQLLEGLSDAIHAMHEAGRALAKAAPNARDYYVQGAGAINTALNQHEARMTKLREVIRELEQIVFAIS